MNTNTARIKKPLMAEMLLTHIVGEEGAQFFARICQERQITLERGIVTAIREFISQSSPANEPLNARLYLGSVHQPDASDCPQGQEAHWIELCEHDIAVLRAEHSRCAASRDVLGQRRITVLIESYLQALSNLRDRVA